MKFERALSYARSAITGLTRVARRTGRRRHERDPARQQRAGRQTDRRAGGNQPCAFRVTPMLGRFFIDAEGEPGNQRKVVLTPAFWQQQFAGDRDIVGRDIRLDGEQHTVVGVLPETFRFLSPETKLYRPLAFTAEQKSDNAHHNNNWTMIARLKPGVPAPRRRRRSRAAVLRDKSMDQRLSDTLVNRRTPMVLAVFVGSVALFLAGIGIYGVLAYRVSQRGREIGIRMALGSEPRGIFTLVLREGAIMVALGFVIGFASAVAVRGAMRAQLFGVGPLDPFVLVMVALTLAVVALLACAMPARRASRVDPLTALADA